MWKFMQNANRKRGLNMQVSHLMFRYHSTPVIRLMLGLVYYAASLCR
jgi:hypothetical protein